MIIFSIVLIAWTVLTVLVPQAALSSQNNPLLSQSLPEYTIPIRGFTNISIINPIIALTNACRPDLTHDSSHAAVIMR